MNQHNFQRHIPTIIVTIVVLALGLSCARTDTEPRDQLFTGGRHPVGEASGIVRVGSDLLIVDDERAGQVFRVHAPTDSFDTIDPTQVTLERGWSIGCALDLESIDILADGRVVVLSERLRSLIARDGIIAEYDDVFSELGGRGLEGLAVRHIADTSEIAVVWEGGYLNAEKIPTPVAPMLDSIAMNAVVLIHLLPQNPGNGKPSEQASTRMVTLQLPRDATGTSPYSSLRVPDLVWHADGEQFIVLLNAFDILLLQRFNAATGEAIGEPLDLDTLSSIPDSVRAVKPNWEGLAWYEKNCSLVLIDDKGKHRTVDKSPYLVIIPLPIHWRSR